MMFETINSSTAEMNVSVRTLDTISLNFDSETHGKMALPQLLRPPAAKFKGCPLESKYGQSYGTLVTGEDEMSPEVSELLKRAMALPIGERAALANTLLDSLEAPNDSVASHSVEDAWDDEVERRMRDLKAGRSVTVPWEKLHRELLAMVTSGRK